MKCYRMYQKANPNGLLDEFPYFFILLERKIGCKKWKIYGVGELYNFIHLDIANENIWCELRLRKLRETKLESGLEIISF
jgi:hypothetical protein